MGVLDWLKKKIAGEEAGELTFSAEEENFEGLNMKEVIDAHLGWRTRLERVISGNSTEHLDPEGIKKSDQCALGKWIDSSGKKFSTTNEYRELIEAHNHFHYFAAQVIVNHNDGNTRKATEILDSDFKMFSSRVQLKIIELYSVIYKNQGKV
ncbi:MAG: CZB domain-containing protein [Bacteroidota bacterium]